MFVIFMAQISAQYLCLTDRCRWCTSIDALTGVCTVYSDVYCKTCDMNRITIPGRCEPYHNGCTTVDCFDDW